ncbi:MAG TPA: sulfatase [Chitinophagaceae bacterium]|nr:sulfatase [Chitinophagaceae bacterium]
MIMFKYFGVSFVLALLLISAAAQEKGSVKKDLPNIILFIADDLGVNDIEPYGNKVIKTPNLARLSGESLRFLNAFATSPTCAPSRSSMFTGLMPVRHGAHGNHGGVKEGTKSLPYYLKPLGYTVSIAGKLHVGPDEVFDFERIPNTNVPESGHEKKPGLNYDLNLAPVDSFLSAQGKGKPFMLIVADHSPHVIWPEKAGYKPGDVDIPAKHIDTKETRASRARYYTDVTKMDGNLGRVINSLEKSGLSENTILIFTADQGPQWPFAKWSLYDDGIKVPLIIRWPGKVNKGGKTDVMVSLADLLPTMVDAAGGKAPSDIDGKSFLALLSGTEYTSQEYVFATHTGDGMTNRSPARMLRTSRYKYILNIAPGILYTTHIDRAKDHDGGREYWDSWRERSFTHEHAAAVLWRYHNRPAEELYDLESDPGETHNIVSESSSSILLKRFRDKLAEWRKLQNDFFNAPEEIKAPTPGAKPKKTVAPYVF